MVSIDNRSFGKIVLHCYKYPSLQVFGLLLGKVVDKANVQILDAIPLFHGVILAPMLELSLKLVERYSVERDLTVLGCYYAEENNCESENLNPTVQLIGYKIHEKIGSAFIVQVLNDQLTPNHFSNLPVYSATQGWDKSIINFSDDTGSFLERILSDELWHKLHDFDSHLQDIRNDWLNETIFQ